MSSPFPKRRDSRKKDRASKAQKKGTAVKQVAASYSRYSTTNQDDKSIEDQQRECCDLATKEGVRIAPHCEFFDAAISGTKSRRPGLDRMLEAAASGEFNTLFVFSLSRLARNTAILIPMLKQLIEVHHVRVVSVSEHFDSSRDNWEMLMHILAMLHERCLKELRANVLRGMEGTILAGYSIGDYCLGYTSLPDPNGAMIGRGRDAKPRMIYAKDPVTSEIVKLIFHWFVTLLWSIADIVRELNRRKAPKDHRATTTVWTRPQAIHVLDNPKYLGLWGWGEMMNVRNPLDGKLSQELRPEEESRKWLRELPELRLIDDATWAMAQVLLEANAERVGVNRRKNGQFGGTAPDCGRGHFLGAILKCRCGRHLHVGGSHGKYMFCPSYVAGVCECQAHLPRQVAQQKFIAAIEQLFRSDDPWRCSVLVAAVAAWEGEQAHRPQERTRLMAEVEQHKQARQSMIDFVATCKNKTPDPGIEGRLSDELQQQLEKERQLRDLDAHGQLLEERPTEAWIRPQLALLADTVAAGDTGGRDKLRELLDGPIQMSQVSVDYAPRPIWRGTMVVSMAQCVAAVLPGVEAAQVNCAETRTIALDLWAPRSKTAAFIEFAWDLLMQKRTGQEIAQELGISESRTSVILTKAAKIKGLSPEQYKDLRDEIARERRKPTHSDQIRDEVVRLYQENELISDLARRFEVSCKMIRGILGEWFAAQGKKRPDERTRRSQLGVRPKRAEGTSETDAGPEMHDAA